LATLLGTLCGYPLFFYALSSCPHTISNCTLQTLYGKVGSVSSPRQLLLPSAQQQGHTAVLQALSWRGRIVRPSALVSKTSRVHALEGSNPSLSAQSVLHYNVERSLFA